MNSSFGRSRTDATGWFLAIEVVPNAVNWNTGSRVQLKAGAARELSDPLIDGVAVSLDLQ
jgi:hypothetical protein